MSLTLERQDEFTCLLAPVGAMKVPVTFYLSEKIRRRVEDGALRQAADAACLDARSSVLATPDIHSGFGVPIGSVLASPAVVSPSAVGYDINCGMRLLSTPLQASEADPARIAGEIGNLIPLGEGKSNLHLNRGELVRVLERGLPALRSALPRLGLLAEDAEFELYDHDRLCTEDQGSMAASVGDLPERAVERGLPQLGTLGGGNHFIEIQRVDRILDKDGAEALGLRQDRIMIMIHSGSRGLGHETAGHYMRAARDYVHRHGLVAPNSQLHWFPVDSPEGRRYIGAMNAAANYAFANREAMALLVRRAMREVYGPGVAAAVRSLYDVPHNMAKKERHQGVDYVVHRKGATRAFDADRMAGTPFAHIGQPVLIPGSMGTASYVLLGHQGSARSLFSVNHGAGRVMSRTEAAGKKGRPGAISDRDFRKAMEGVYLIAENRRRIKEEAPQAYKDIDEVVRVVAGAGLAVPVARLVPLAVLKG